MKNINFEILISLLALFVSAISIILTYISLKSQRKHNILSVKPIPEIQFRSSDTLVIILANLGIGPLVCEQLIIKDEFGTTKNSIIDFFPDEVQSISGRMFTNNYNFTIPINEYKGILLINSEFRNIPETKDIIKNTLSKLTIELYYTSIYNEKTYFYSRNLEWFEHI